MQTECRKEIYFDVVDWLPGCQIVESSLTAELGNIEVSIVVVSLSILQLLIFIFCKLNDRSTSKILQDVHH